MFCECEIEIEQPVPVPVPPRPFVKPPPRSLDDLVTIRAAIIRAELELYMAGLNRGVLLKDGRRIPVAVRTTRRPR